MDAKFCVHHVCGCGNQPPYHCMYCCKDLTDEELLEEFRTYPGDPHRAFAKFRDQSVVADANKH